MPRLRLMLAVVLGLLALAAPAGAAGRSDIISDCEDDSKLSGSYTPGELRDARNNLPSDTDAYSDCRDVLAAALSAGARRSAQGGAGGGGGEAAGAASGAPGGERPRVPNADGAAAIGSLSTAPGAGPPQVSAEERRALREAQGRLPEVEIRGQRVVPGVRGVAGETASAAIPASLMTTLVLLGVSAVLGAAVLLRRRVVDRRAA